MRALGLMSGTSMDGVDVALIDTDGERQVTAIAYASFFYRQHERAVLRDAIAAAAGLRDRDERPAPLRQAEDLVTERHAVAVERFLETNSVAASTIDIVGLHGQTVLHRPEARLTIQIGDGQALAARLGLLVAWDFRAADVASGGQGAPLVPAYHVALAANARFAGPAVVVNIGGVANLTFIVEGQDPIACDTGPGNALIDDLVFERTGRLFDGNGELADAGRVDPEALTSLLDHPYFAMPAPKSLDRNAFSRSAVAHLATADAAATLTAFTAAAIALAVSGLPVKPEQAIVCGGGARNPCLMRELAARLPCRLASADDVGWSVDGMEAEAFAYLAVRRLRDLPITFPGTTGIAAPLAGGRLSRP